MGALAITQFLDSPTSSFLSPKKVAQRLSLQVGDLADTARVHRNTLNSRPQSPKVQALLRNILRVIEAATEAFGGRDQAITWMMNEPLQTFRYRTAYTLIGEARTDDIVSYLDSIAGGFAG